MIADESPEQAYFHAIEVAFIELRGAPLLLSPKDWQTARTWHERGIPEAFVVARLREIFAKRLVSGTVDRVSSLRYCSRSILASWKEEREILGPSTAPRGDGLDIVDRLERLASAMPRDWPPGAGIVEEIRACSGNSENIEGRLAALDSRMIEAAEDDASPESLQRLRGRARARAALLEDRLSEPAVAAARSRFEIDELRRARKLPVLSLFSVDAQSS